MKYQLREEGIMRKMQRMLTILTALMMLLTACGIAVAEQETRKMESAADADEWIAAFLGEHPEELEGVWAMTADMEAGIAQMGGIAGLAKQLAALGTPAEISPAYEGSSKGYTLYCIPCVFSTMSLDLILVVQDGAIAGLQTGTYSGGQKEEAKPETFDSIDLPLPVPGLGELPGILTVPNGDGPFPAVILLQGSGSSDKDETIGSLKPFRDIAEGLAEQGVAVYRFDKRTYAYAMQLAFKTDFTLVDEYLEDAVNAVQLVAQQEKIDPDRIFVLGHSLGGSAVPAIAAELENAPVKARGFIMMAASARRLDVVIREQYDFLYSLMPEVTAEQLAEKDALFAELDQLQDPDSLADTDRIAGVFAPYWKWLIAYDIVQAADQITQPVLVLQGEEDYQATMEDYGIWQQHFGNKANWRMISYPGLTHIFITGQKSEGSAVYSRNEKVSENVILDIASFVLQN